MGKIRKTASSRHEASLSPFLSDFVKTAIAIPLYQLPEYLASFPGLWPFPRGDLYHWIGLLNRFDDILEQFVDTYQLKDGPQTVELATKVLLTSTTALGSDEKCTPAQLEEQGFSVSGDKKLVECVMDFTALLLDNCGNRSLYASSEHLDKLLNTTDLSLIISVLSLALRLAKRYSASRVRYSSQSVSLLLHNHYRFDLENLHRLAYPFMTFMAVPPENPFETRPLDKTSGQDEAGVDGETEAEISGLDLAGILRQNTEDLNFQNRFGHVQMTVYKPKEGLTSDETGPAHEEPESPTLARSNGTSRRQVRRARSGLENDAMATPARTSPQVEPISASAKPTNSAENINITRQMLSSTPVCEILREYVDRIPTASMQELLCRTRIAAAMVNGGQARDDIVSIRLLALANVAYIDADTQYQQKIGIQDFEQSRRYQLATQLATMVQPSEASSLSLSLNMQTHALWALEAIAKQKSYGSEVYNALNANVNHGILFFIVRQAVTQISRDSAVMDTVEERWRDALFSLLSTLPATAPRAGESMMSAGLLDILVEVLGLRTAKAERTHNRVLSFLDTFVYSVRESLLSLANAKGLDAIADLSAYTVDSAFERVATGEGMPEEYKTQLTDYAIPFYQQLTLRWLAKFMNHTMSQNSGNMNRQLRNLIESPQVLGSLRKILGNSRIFGANVWSGAVVIFATYIHSEPTSYNVIAEARLGETFLDAVTAHRKSTKENGSTNMAILPVAELILTIPTAFGALCLNENGAKLLNDSGALEIFFDIFTSSEHIKGINLETDTAEQLGSAFDELVRHQPTLKESIVKSVVKMVTDVYTRCYDRAKEGVGAKLYKTGPDQRMYIVGGRTALSETTSNIDDRASSQETDGDTTMAPPPTNQQTDHSGRDEVCVDDIIDRETTSTGHIVSFSVAVIGRFLSGFFTTKASCQSFIEHGGLYPLINIYTVPSLWHAYEVRLAYGNEVSGALQSCIEEKPHLALPAVLNRLNRALDTLEPLLNCSSPESFFAAFTQPGITADGTQNPHFSNGTLYVKALLIAETLLGVLRGTFLGQTRIQRSQTHIFYQVNFADMYVKTIEKLGRLRSSCVWETIVLERNMPIAWESISRPLGSSRVEDQRDSSGPDLSSNGASDAELGVVDTNGTSAEPSRASQPTREDLDKNNAYFRNTGTLRYLFFMLSNAISDVFQTLAKILLIRRVSESYSKSNAVRVANQLAKTAIEYFKFERVKISTNRKARVIFWKSGLKLIKNLVSDDSESRPQVQINTLTLQSFAYGGGFAVLNALLEVLLDLYKADVQATDRPYDADNDPVTLKQHIETGIGDLLQLFQRVATGRNIVDAAQTQTLASRNSDRGKPEYFSGPQFLVELRLAVIRPSIKLWTSGIVEHAYIGLVRDLITTLRVELEGDQETSAYTRNDTIPKRTRPAIRKWKLKSTANLAMLKIDFPEDLAIEALFRCHENLTAAKEYCRDQQRNPHAQRNPVPDGDMVELESLPPASTSDDTQDTNSQMNDIATDPAELTRPVFRDIADSDDPLSFMTAIPGMPPGLLESLRDAPLGDGIPPVRDSPLGEALPSATSTEEVRTPGEPLLTPTIDDLNEERDKLRSDLVDRCLDVLNVHGNLSFEIAELLTASVASHKSSNATMRNEIGSTLLLSLMSLQIDDELSEEDFRTQVKKVASYAHLLALVLQDTLFYDALHDELIDNFDALTGFIKVYPEDKTRDTPSWIGQILLIQEKLLSSDLEPKTGMFDRPNSDDPIVDYPPLALICAGHQCADASSKESLLQALLDIMPTVAKSEMLALSVSRVLVSLTRDRSLALRLGEKQNLDRYFKMIKQLCSFRNEQLQSTVLIVLRHIIEDDDTLRQIMKSEILAFFEGRNKQIEVTTYLRNAAHLVLRNVQIFVDVSHEILRLVKYDSPSSQQLLEVKPSESAEEEKGLEDKETAPAVQPAKTSDIPSKPPLERVKTSDLKMPVVDTPGGVVHHLISELLVYKEVEDPKPTVKTQQTDADVKMDDGSTPDPSSGQQIAATSTSAKETGQEFKNDEHPIFIYKCFLLQCLSELLQSYNRAKHEFINYKRTKIDPSTTTPSKPRSFVLNYLLSNLIPCGFLHHPTNVREKKVLSISQWASSVVTSLCVKTGELGHVKPPSDLSKYQEEPDLLFVQRFVLEHALRVFKDAHANSEPLELKYSRLLSLSDLFYHLLRPKIESRAAHSATAMEMGAASQRILARTMLEKNFIASLTTSVAEIDLNFPETKRVVKYILRPLEVLTRTAVDLSMHSDFPLRPGEEEDDDISTASSSESEMDQMREETPDLFRNSALGILDPRRDEDEEDDSSHEDDDEAEMYEEEYADDMEYEEEDRDPDEVISDDDEEGMGPMEGLPGDVPMDLEVDLMDPDDIDEEASDMDDEDMNDEDMDEDDEDDEENGGMDLEEMDEEGMVGEMGADDADWGTEDEDEGSDMAYAEGFTQPYDPDLDAALAGSEIPEIMDVIENGRQVIRRLDNDTRALLGEAAEDFLDEGDLDDEEEDEEEDADDYEGEDITYEPEADEDEDGDMDQMGVWEYDGPHAGHHHHHHHHHHRHTHIHGHPGRMQPWGGMFGISVGADDRGAPPYRVARGSQRRPDDGVNPLLQRSNGNGGSRDPHHGDPLISYVPRVVPRRGDDPNTPVSFISNLLNMMNHAPMPAGMRIGFSIDGQTHTGPEGMDALFRAIGAGPRQGGHGHSSSHRTARNDPSSAVTFTIAMTTVRWVEETRQHFGISGPDYATRLADAILCQLIPAARRAQLAVEEARKKAQEEQEAERRRADEEKERKAKEALEEDERKKAQEAKEAAESAAQDGSATAASNDNGVVADDMEGVESTQNQSGQTEPDQATERIIVQVRGRDVDITGLGIDMAYMEELPEEWREEVILQQIAQARAAAPVETQPVSGLPTDFLEALPEEIRREFEEHEAQERRRREREEARRAARATGQTVMPEEMDAASFFATLADPHLRQDLLMHADDDLLNNLPPDLVAEAHALGAGQQMRRFNERARRPGQPVEAGAEEVVRKVRPVVQILDKAGVATLMRLMFVPQNHGMKSSLNGILKDVCANKQNRAEVVSLLLLILQDGSSDMVAVEKSFMHLSLRAKQPAGTLKTPQGKTAGVEPIQGSTETSPLIVVQQCLNALSYLVHANKGVADFFLREHEMGANLKVRMLRKGKNKETKANKFPINALLNLLDHKLVVDSSPAMEQLASLLATITHPLLSLQKREKEKAQFEAIMASEAAVTETGGSSNAPDVEAAPEGNAPTSEALNELAPTAGDEVMATEDQPADTEVPEGDTEETAGRKKSRTVEAPPEIPEQNLRLVVSIIAARECSSKTFKDTLSLMTHLSAVPKAKNVFGTELRSRAQDLGENILKDLQHLLDQIGKSKNGIEVQGLALSRFSPASSDQGKLLRVITTLDYLFDPKRVDVPVSKRDPAVDGLERQTREDILTSLYENDVFGPLWIKLSDTLTAVGEHGNLLSIATILLPLIEVLMVVCKNTTLKDAPISSSLKEVTLSSPPPESRIESIFFKFTEEHRKILNDLVRHNPKLMSGSFSLLVKNSKVLEFDNKRNYFHRQLHTRRSENRAHPSLQLSVRRADVFLDSYKALYYKKPDEIKFGKLNIRFSGEEGVDAGGVTREWFQVLAKQMFNPNYALFNPITADRTTFHPNPLSGVNGEHLAFFKFVGRIIGKAMYESRVLDCHFSRAVYKKILGKSVNLKDMESLDQEFYKSMEWILHNDITDIIIDTFSIEEEVFGENKITDLIENGRNIPVTEENKQEYVQRMVDYKMIGSVEEQLEHFLVGFHDIVPSELISIFNEQELELLISGLPDIDVDDWKNNTDYSNYQSSSPQIQWFWRAVRSFDKEERAKLLQFITGTSRVPLNGFKELEGMNGFTRFNIHRDYQDKSRLPSSHTCFNQLDLPEYESYEQLRKALYTAMTQGSEYFGFA